MVYVYVGALLVVAQETVSDDQTRTILGHDRRLKSSFSREVYGFIEGELTVQNGVDFRVDDFVGTPHATRINRTRVVHDVFGTKSTLSERSGHAGLAGEDIDRRSVSGDSELVDSLAKLPRPGTPDFPSLLPSLHIAKLEYPCSSIPS